MAKLVLDDITNLNNQQSVTGTLNLNSFRIETAVENTLSRDGTEPNEMESPLDMNSNKIYNLPKAETATEPVRKKEFDEAVFGEAGSGEATQLEVTYVSATNKAVPNPNLPGSGDFIIDGNVVQTNDRILFINQTSPVQNGVWVYDEPSNTLSRPSDYYSGMDFSQPFFVSVTSGETYNGLAFELISPVTGTVDIDETTWVENETGAGNQFANTVIAGSYRPTFGARLAEIRPLAPTDTPRYDNSRDVANYPQSIYVNLNNFGYLSRYIIQSAPFTNITALVQCLHDFNTVIFDRTFTFTTQLTASLSRKHLVFLGSGRDGDCKVFMDTKISSFCDLSNQTDIRFEGMLVLDYCDRANAGVKAIKGTNITRFKADSIVTRNVDDAINVAGTIIGFSVNSIEVDSLVTDQAIVIASASATNSVGTYIGRVVNLPAYETVTTNANTTHRAFKNSPVVNLSGARTANRVITLSLEQANEGYRTLFKHNATGGFNFDIGGLKTIVNGQSAEVMITSGAWVLIA